MNADANSFEPLLTRLYELLEAERYSGSTMRDMRSILHSMSNYVEAYRLDNYSPEIGERFAAYCVNDLRICSSR
ncbi:MAG: hypothetical protein LBU32_24270, partial [Clostridiales bacterium]|nr:hypothetical protein [Clostridiales bacterium]